MFLLLRLFRYFALFSCITSLAGCSHLFYYPDSYQYREKGTYPFPVADLSIARGDKGPIHAWLMNDVPESKGLILQFHGNAQNLSAHSDFTSWLAQAGYTVLIFDYSGYGKTRGMPTQKELIDDAGIVLGWIADNDHWRAKGKPFIVFAQSLGGAIATTALASFPEEAAKVDLLIVESSFDSYREVAARKLKSSPVTWLFSSAAYGLVSEYREPREAVKTLKMRKIFIHGSADRVVPFESGKALYTAAISPKEFWEIPYGDHTEAFAPGSPYREALLKELTKITKP